MPSTPIARLDRVTFAHTSGPTLIDALTLDIPRGVTAVVGENGAGKSTLLDLLDGTRTPDDGRITRPRALVRVSQDVAHPPCARTLLDPRIGARFAVDNTLLARFDTSSPGERRRAQLAWALSAEAELLLLDEPTNHLDEEARAVLQDELRRARGAVVLVSHDRALVDALAARTVLLHRGRAAVTEGGFTRAFDALSLAQRAHVAARETARAVVDQERRALAQARARATSAEAQRSARARMKSKHDRDARGLGAQFRADRAAARSGHDVTSARSALSRAERDLAERAPIDRVFGAELTLAATPLSRPWLVDDVRVRVRRGARLRVLGPNGSGKTTLLRHIVAHARGDAFFLPQDLGDDVERAVLARLHALPRDVRGRHGQLSAALGLDPARLASSTRPSMGEAKKLALIDALMGAVPALVLDEPTNHLDLVSAERLARALATYDGTLVVVTHDDAFAEAARLSETLTVARAARG